MKKIIFAAAAFAALCSCAKQEESTTPLQNNGVTVSFVAEPNSSQTKAFFDATATTEAWEKSLNTLTIFVFDGSGTMLLERNFTPAEVTAKKATFPLPRTSAGTTCEFYAIANKNLSGVTTKASLLAQMESAPSTYNGTFANVSTQAPSGGYVMSGSATKAVAAAGASTDVAISLKRTVAKIAIQASLSSDFGSKYSGSVRITSATLSRAASQSPVIAPASPSPGTMNYTSTQTTAESAGKFNNLFYSYENGALATGSRMMVTLTGVYDKDGNFSTTADQTPVTYDVELNGAAGNGQILRNGYYRVAITLAGLTGQDVNATITVADWETPVTQNINLGM